MKLGIVVPCYNEEAVIDHTVVRLLQLLDALVEKGKVATDSRLYCVDDGSKDATWEKIERLHQTDPRVCGVKLAGNRGHQNALLAGLFTAEGDALVSIDADLQDDIGVIEEMVDARHDGAEIVYGVRRERPSDSPFKKHTASLFYKLMALLGASVVYNHADYRLLSRRAVEALKKFREVNLFLRGMVPLIGLTSAVVYYDRAERFAGESKYPLRKMISFALDGITSFSIVPLRIISFIGFSIFFLTLILSAWALGVKLFGNSAVPGWTSTVLPVYFIGGIQILCLGVMGEYLGKIYREVKARPRYLIEKTL